MKVWVCQVRQEVFVGGESQRCRHSEMCEECGGKGSLKTGCESGVSPLDHLRTDAGHAPCAAITRPCPICNGTGQVSECGEMELIGGEPVEWCVAHDAERGINKCFRSKGKQADPCSFESQIRVGP